MVMCEIANLLMAVQVCLSPFSGSLNLKLKRSFFGKVAEWLKAIDCKVRSKKIYIFFFKFL